VAPTPVALAIAEAIGRVARLAGRESEAGAATVRMLGATGDVSIEKATAVLGWEPVVDLEEGMRRTETWLRREGLLASASASASAPAAVPRRPAEVGDAR
jgi:nucleoside-diphosphate-sugar epimerase